MNQKFKKVCEEVKILQIPEVQELLGREMEVLHNLGVQCYEIEFIVDLKIKEELIIGS